jgi:hypothetical protein
MRILSLALSLDAMSLVGSAQPGQKPQENPLTGPVQTFDPAHQRSLSYEDKSIHVDLALSENRRFLSIKPLPAGVAQRVQLPEEMAQVDEIRRDIHGRIIVRGMVTGSGSEIVIVEPTSRELQDKFFCYLPAVSPDGHFITFIKFYPDHFSGNVEDHYMLYDLTKRASENRPTGLPPGDSFNVGTPIYPIGVGNRAGDNSDLPERPAHHYASAGFFWNSNSHDFVFADRLDGTGTITLVHIDINNSGRFRLRVLPQEIKRLCPLHNGKERECPLLVRQVKFGSATNNSIATTFEIVDVQRLVTVEYKLSQFRPTD